MPPHPYRQGAACQPRWPQRGASSADEVRSRHPVRHRARVHRARRRRRGGKGWDQVFSWESVWGQDAWVTLGAAAMVTERIRLGTLLTPAARHRPWDLASRCASVDRLSDGRVTLGVGLGALHGNWLAFEPDEGRAVQARKLDEASRSTRASWAGSRSSTRASTTAEAGHRARAAAAGAAAAPAGVVRRDASCPGASGSAPRAGRPLAGRLPRGRRRTSGHSRLTLDGLREVVDSIGTLRARRRAVDGGLRRGRRG